MKIVTMVVVFVMMVLCVPCDAQHLIYLDSIHVSPASPTVNDSIEVLIFGKYADTGVSISNIIQTNSPNKVTIDIYAIMCSGVFVLVPFDTSINIGQLSQGNYLIQYRGTWDTIATDSIYCFQNDILSAFDSATINLSVLQTGIFTPAFNNQFQISSNPVQNLLTINFLSPSALASGETIAVYDVQGRKIVLPTTYSNNKAELTTTTLPNGIYLLQIINNKTGMSEVGKFVKEE